MKSNQIAVIGGTGKSGTYLVKQLIKNNYKLKMLVRDPEKVQEDHSSIEIVKGDARDFNSILSLIQGCHAVISTLGQPIGEASIFSEATVNVIRAMEQCGIARYIVTTGLNVDTPYDQKDEWVLGATEWMYENFPKTTRDKQIEYDVLTKSKLVWTLVRLPMIIQTNERFPVKVSLENCMGKTISATDLADFLIAQLTDKSFERKSPFVSNE